MSKIELIRAGHTQVADGQCGLCDVPWPCDVGVVLAALAAAEARAEQAEDARDAADARANAEWARAEMLTQDNARLRERAEQAERRADVADVRAQKAERFSALWKQAAKKRRAMEQTACNVMVDLVGAESQDNARLRSRLATVEAALAFYADASNYEGVSRVAYSNRPDRFGPLHWEASDVDEDRGARARAALAATPADDPIPPMQPRVTYSATVRVGEVRRAAPHVYDDEIAYEDMAATPATDEPAELSMIRAGDELVLEIDAALDDAATPAAGEVADSYQPVPPKSEFPMTVRLDVQDRREQQRQHGGEG